MSNNIVQFPLDKRLEKIYEEDEKRMDKEFEINSDIENIADDLLENLMIDLYEAEYTDLESDNYVYDVSILYESIKSLIAKINDTYHPLQIFAEQLYTNAIRDMNDNQNSSQIEFDF